MDCQEITQKRIDNRVRVSSSLYTLHLSALNNKVNNENIGAKHNSYHRRLQNLKNKTITKGSSNNITSYADKCEC